MRSGGGNPLDLNNLPEEYSDRWREGKQSIEESSSATTASTDASRIKKKRSGGKDEPGKVYECRFCSLKFCKSQALGGHMNRHRQERETETLNRARQLVFGTETLAPTHGSLIGFGGGQPMSSGGGGGFYNRDQCLNLRPVYPRLPTMLPQSQQHQPPPPPPLQPYLYTSNSHHFPNPTTQQYPPPPPHMNADYLVGHVFSGNNNSHHRPPSGLNYTTELNYTCIGGAPPLAHGFPAEGVHGTVTGDVNRGNRTDGLSRDGSDSSSMHPLGSDF